MNLENAAAWLVPLLVAGIGAYGRFEEAAFDTRLGWVTALGGLPSLGQSFDLADQLVVAT